MRKIKLTKALIVCMFLFTMSSIEAQQMKNREQFLSFWSYFKNAIKNNDANYLFSHTSFPFDAQGTYFNEEASLEEVTENSEGVFPKYLHEMEFVRFDAVLVEGHNAYIWLGYSFEDDAYFYCYKHMPTKGDTSFKTYEEKYWFKLMGNKFMFFHTTLGIE